MLSGALVEDSQRLMMSCIFCLKFAYSFIKNQNGLFCQHRQLVFQKWQNFGTKILTTKLTNLVENDFWQ